MAQRDIRGGGTGQVPRWSPAWLAGGLADSNAATPFPAAPQTPQCLVLLCFNNNTTTYPPRTRVCHCQFLLQRVAPHQSHGHTQVKGVRVLWVLAASGVEHLFFICVCRGGGRLGWWRVIEGGSCLLDCRPPVPCKACFCHRNHHTRQPGRPPA